MRHIAMNEEMLPGFENLPPSRCLLQRLFGEALNPVAIPQRYDPNIHSPFQNSEFDGGLLPHAPMACLPAGKMALPRHARQGPIALPSRGGSPGRSSRRRARCCCDSQRGRGRRRRTRSRPASPGTSPTPGRVGLCLVNWRSSCRYTGPSTIPTDSPPCHRARTRSVQTTLPGSYTEKSHRWGAFHFCGAFSRGPA